MDLCRCEIWKITLITAIFASQACKPVEAQGPQYPASNSADPNESDKDGQQTGPAKAAKSSVPKPPGTPTTPQASTGSTSTISQSPLPPNANSTQPGGGAGGFLGGLLSQFGGGSGLGGLSGLLSGLSSGLGGIDLSSLLGSFGGGGSGGFGGSGGNIATNSSQPTPAAAAPNASLSELRQACLAAINQYRASTGRSALTLKDDNTNTCVDKQSADDGAIGRAHGHFGACGESAQDECPGWGGDPGSAQQGCLKMMWNEGPGGGHYENMNNPAYKQVSCGYAQVGGSWWMIQNFYR